MKFAFKGERYPLKIVLFYLIVSAAWIFFSDRLINSDTFQGFTDLELQTLKGMLFVVVTSALLYVLIKRGMDTITRSRERIQNALREKEYLLSELNHRVRNNLAIIAGMIELEGDDVKSEEARNILMATSHRIHALGNIQKLFYEDKDPKRVPFHKFFTRQLETLQAEVASRERIECRLDEINLNVNQAVPLALLLCEVLSQIRLNIEKGMLVEIAMELKALPDSRVSAGIYLVNGKKGLAERLMSMESLLESPLVEAYTGQLEGDISWREDGGSTGVTVCFAMTEETGSSANRYFRKKIKNF